MRIKLPHFINKLFRYVKLKFMPKTLFLRTMLLIFIPLIVVQIVSIAAFFDGSWGKVGKRLSNNLASNMAFIVKLMENEPSEQEKISELAEKFYDLKVNFYSENERNNVLNIRNRKEKMITKFLEKSLKKEFPEASRSIYLSHDHENLYVYLDMPEGIYEFQTSPKNIFSTAIFGFMAWMIGTSLLLFAVAALFLRVQVRSIAELAKAAEDFGKGINNTYFKPYGSVEVRRAGYAFMKMKERIMRQISERTQMLAGVSHDLRTPLTRMKLSIAMMHDIDDQEEFLADIYEMEKMLDGYLAFVAGESGEPSTFVDINEMILSIINKFRNTQALIKYSTNDQVSAIQGREQALKRALTNVISNAFDYGKTIAVKLESNNKKLEITVDDDGPGIPEDKREDVFKAFYRIEGSRNKETGGVGLGLAIAKDVITSHGGKIELSDSDMGGLRVLISIPL